MLKSIKGRIVLLLSLAMLVVIVTLSCFASYEYKELMYDDVDERLKNDNAIIKDFVTRNEDSQIMLNSIEEWIIQRNLICRIWSGSSITIYASENIPTGLLSNLPEKSGKWSCEIDNTVYRCLYDVIQVEMAGEAADLHFFLAQEPLGELHEIDEFVKVLIFLGLVIFLICVVFIYSTVRQSLLPLQKTAQWMKDASINSLEEIANYEYIGATELIPFVDSWKTMLTRLSDAMKENRRFTSDASHELRTPLAVIKSSLQLAQSQSRTNEYYQRIIADTLDDIDRLSVLVNNLLELSRLDNIAYSKTFVNVELGPVIGFVVSSHKSAAQKRRQEISTVLTECCVRGDLILLERMISNLLDNAIEYGPVNSRVKIALSVENDSAIITVSDTGGSIPLDKQQQIFERFYRADPSRTRQTGGTGLGLAIVCEIVKLHNGTISVTSNNSVGTVFCIKIPLADNH